jgi:hypothetical protein
MAVCWVVALMIEAASTSEMSVNFYHTKQRNNPATFIIATVKTSNFTKVTQNLY